MLKWQLYITYQRYIISTSGTCRSRVEFVHCKRINRDVLALIQPADIVGKVLIKNAATPKCYAASNFKSLFLNTQRVNEKNRSFNAVSTRSLTSLVLHFHVFEQTHCVVQKLKYRMSHAFHGSSVIIKAKALRFS